MNTIFNFRFALKNNNIPSVSRSSANEFPISEYWLRVEEYLDVASSSET